MRASNLTEPAELVRSKLWSLESKGLKFSDECKPLGSTLAQRQLLLPQHQRSNNQEGAQTRLLISEPSTGMLCAVLRWTGLCCLLNRFTAVLPHVTLRAPFYCILARTASNSVQPYVHLFVDSKIF